MKSNVFPPVVFPLASVFEGVVNVLTSFPVRLYLTASAFLTGVAFFAGASFFSTVGAPAVIVLTIVEPLPFPLAFVAAFSTGTVNSSPIAFLEK